MWYCLIKASMITNLNSNTYLNLKVVCVHLKSVFIYLGVNSRVYLIHAPWGG